MQFVKKYDEGIDPGNPWGETRTFHPDDELLRAHGFRVQARPRRGPALWARGGEVLPFAAAVALAREEEASQCPA